MKTIYILFVALAVLIASPIVAKAQSNEERIGKLEGGLPGAVARIEVLESLIIALQSEVLALSGAPDLGPAVTANTAAIAEMNGGGGDDWGPAIAENFALIQTNVAGIAANDSLFPVVQGHTADISNLFVRVEDLEILVEDGGGGGAGSPGLVIAAETMDSTIDETIYPLDTPIFSGGCQTKNGALLRNCLLVRQNHSPEFYGYGLQGGIGFDAAVRQVHIVIGSP